MPGQSRIVLSSTPLAALDTRQSFGADGVKLLPNVCALAGEIRLKIAQSAQFREFQA
jgi:hypothetical protein